jgi:hypothetical protein
MNAASAILENISAKTQEQEQKLSCNHKLKSTTDPTGMALKVTSGRKKADTHTIAVIVW